MLSVQMPITLFGFGLGYQSNYSGYANHRIEGDNIGYAVHLYPGWMNSDGENGDGGSSTGGYQPFQNGWDRQVGWWRILPPSLLRRWTGLLLDMMLRGEKPLLER